MNKTSRNEIERSLQDSEFEAYQHKGRSLELPTKNESGRRQSRIIGGNPNGVSRQVPKKKYGWWIASISLILLSSLVFIIPEFLTDAPKISKEQNNPENQIYIESKIEEATEQVTNNTADGFTVPDDRNRATEYRQAEATLQQLNELKSKAEAAIKEGNYTKPLNNNAYQYYQQMLTLNENSVTATDGMSYILKRLFDVGLGGLKTGNVNIAKNSLQSLSDVDNESEEYFDLSEAISNFEAVEVKKQRTININKLYTKAEKSIEKQRLTTPKNDNASLYFQQILELDPGNKKAREGIDKISQKYADLTEKLIANQEWEKAETNIKNLRIASKDSVLASFLDKKLVEAKKQAKQNKEQIIAETSLEESSKNIESDTTSIQVQAQNQFTGSSRQGAPAPIQDLSVLSSNVPLRENLTAPAPVSDSLSNRQNNNPANNQSNNQSNNPKSNQRNNDQNNNSSRNQLASQQLNIGLQAYYSGEYITAFSNLAPLADNDDTRAQIRVGYMYQFGRGVSQDTNLGTEYLRKALPDLINRARSNQAWAQSDLGSLYEDGVIVTKSNSEALNWYRQAAAQNYPGAQTNLGNMYFFGKGVEQNQQEAIKWYRLAALGGDAIAKQNLIQLDAINF